ncbi:hypothetical protein ACYZT2_00515 [Pseudomonas sp. MDT1-85]
MNKNVGSSPCLFFHTEWCVGYVVLNNWMVAAYLLLTGYVVSGLTVALYRTFFS